MVDDGEAAAQDFIETDDQDIDKESDDIFTRFEDYSGISQFTQKFILYYLLVQAIIGTLLLEYAFYRSRRFTDNNEMRDSKFPQFRRYDA